MKNIDVLVLHGSPGAGKTTLARVVPDFLREADLAHGVIGLDEISLVHTDQGRSLARENLEAIWPRYAAVPGQPPGDAVTGVGGCGGLGRQGGDNGVYVVFGA
ncbi:hypothetical protein [Streptomyces caniscabiei]|uniref:Uncharacterized protein n=1 Tax=Streptomyces caniscabiei TaxID=2746961 RepID=A0ABU4N519_9ACTN|nr:hypothetical protein [Streptomyces caniscabiei]MBE4734007.1 hypothetical protein [Streptomyces caniscabiei]MBE4761422.1 hypothetical protein [Streptomyces caniscabiei]MBE4775149.1 hypothetical protein [Streptomyces caniscabiei]MBE4782502.1 hypothetical protein [Streptomyces caniscabiei]MBE4791805.1 hypothetical protein [Streptomyces caniscabiei]